MNRATDAEQLAHVFVAVVREAVGHLVGPHQAAEELVERDGRVRIERHAFESRAIGGGERHLISIVMQSLPRTCSQRIGPTANPADSSARAAVLPSFDSA